MDIHVRRKTGKLQLLSNSVLRATAARHRLKPITCIRYGLRRLTQQLFSNQSLIKPTDKLWELLGIWAEGVISDLMFLPSSFSQEHEHVIVKSVKENLSLLSQYLFSITKNRYQKIQKYTARRMKRNDLVVSCFQKIINAVFNLSQQIGNYIYMTFIKNRQFCMH